MASVAEIDGLRGPLAPVPPPLDQYTGAAAAYSVRLLRTAYTGDIMRVRRDSDQNEIDVGFDSNDEFGLTSPVSNATSGSFTDFADFIGHGMQDKPPQLASPKFTTAPQESLKKERRVRRSLH
jgi:hypothetical protein